MTKKLVLLLALAAVPAVSWGSEFSAFLDAEFLGGQFFYQDTASAFGGTAALTFGPAWKMSDRSTLFASYGGSYKGFKDVHDLVGGGQLFQESMDHRLSLKWARQVSETWTFKPRLSYTKELFKETRDEKWTKGLYDYDRYGAGLAAERNGTLAGIPSRFSAGYNAFWTRYPNYKSLSSLFGNELAAVGPGSRTLDTISHDLAFESALGLSPRWDAWLGYTVSLRNFTDQRLANSAGSYDSTLRNDFDHQLNLGSAYRPDWVFGGFRPSVSLDYRLELFQSNQNHLDTNQNQFLPGYYDFLDNTVTLSGEVSARTKSKATLSYSYSNRAYQERLAQDGNGLYLGETLTQSTHLISLSLTYPIYRSLSARASGNWKRVMANTTYEKAYRYTFSSMNYFVGIGYSL